MKFRWTMKELEEATDEKILRALITERQSTLNPYAPLYRRLAKIESKTIKIEERISDNIPVFRPDMRLSR